MVWVQLTMQLPNTGLEDLGSRQATASQFGVIASVGSCCYEGYAIDASGWGHTYGIPELAQCSGVKELRSRYLRQEQADDLSVG
jgi:hypothetical protein